jgi:hypothetical protein
MHALYRCRITAVGVALVLAASAADVLAADSAAMLRARGLELGYNLDHLEALVSFNDAIATDPADPAAYRLTAATTWIHLLFEQGRSPLTTISRRPARTFRGRRRTRSSQQPSTISFVSRSI